jgi:protein SCO1/2
MKPFRLVLGLSLLLALSAAPAPADPPESALDGLTVPDVKLVDQDGRPVRFYTDLVKGQVVAMNFVFTSCGTICPPMGANFAKLQKLLGERRDGKRVRLISVSIDPGNDTPERLKAWAGKFGARPGWTLVTGDRDEVTRLLKALGVYNASPAAHTPVVLVGDDASHHWTRAYGLAPPARLAELIGRVTAPEKEARQ